MIVEADTKHSLIIFSCDYVVINKNDKTVEGEPGGYGYRDCLSVTVKNECGIVMTHYDYTKGDLDKNWYKGYN